MSVMPRHIAAGSRDADHWRWLERGGLHSFAGLAVLDLGCGGGQLCQELARSGARHVIGVDIEAIDRRDSSIPWQFVQADLDASDWTAQIPRADGNSSFDLICGFDIIEHLQSPVSFLRSCAQLLGKGGTLVLTTPNTSSWERLCRGGNWSGATDPQHRILFNPYSLRFLLEREGYAVQSLRAPIRVLETRRIPHPRIGAQMIVVAKHG